MNIQLEIGICYFKTNLQILENYSINVGLCVDWHEFEYGLDRILFQNQTQLISNS